MFTFNEWDIFSYFSENPCLVSSLVKESKGSPQLSHLLYFAFSCCLFKHSDTCLCCDGVCLANLALSLGIPCAPAVLVHTPLVKAGCCCWWLKNQVHLVPPKDATEWIYKENTPKKCCRCVCSEPGGNLIKSIKKAFPDFRREVISSSGVVWLSYAKEARSGFILKLFTEMNLFQG